MPAFITFGRVLFAVLFIYLGATKLFGMQATADFIATKITIPAALAPYTAQLESATGMTTPQLLAVVGGVFEILAGLTFYFYDFWNQTPPENGKTLVDALKNLSIIGALFMIAGYGRGSRSAEPAYGDV